MEATDLTLESDSPEVSDANGMTNSEFRLYLDGKECSACDDDNNKADNP